MKTIATFLTIVLLAIAPKIYSQEYIGSRVHFTKKVGENDSIAFSTTGAGVITLKDDTKQLEINISLSPIVSTAYENDSIAHLNKNLKMNFKADVPVENLNEISDLATYAIDGELTINGITQPYQLSMDLHSSIPVNDYARDIHTYALRVSFIVEINPPDYLLDYETAKFTRTIIVVIENGTINKI